MSKFNFKHLLLIITLILISGISMQWFFHEYIPNPFPNVETYALLIIYSIMLLVTAGIHNTNRFIDLHIIIGFKKTSFKYIVIAIVAGLVIWIIDYLYQSQVLHIDITREALDWISRNKNMTIAFITTVICAPIVEEMLLRGIFLKAFSKYISPFWTILIISALFTILHWSWIQAPTLFIAAVFYAWITFKSKSIIPAIIAHIVNNCLTFIYYLIII